jgi:hypothetical protein
MGGLFGSFTGGAAAPGGGGGFFGSVGNFLGNVGSTLGQVSSIADQFNGLTSGFGSGGSVIDLGGSFGSIAPPIQPFVAFPQFDGPPFGPGATDVPLPPASIWAKVAPAIIAGVVVFAITRK